MSRSNDPADITSQLDAFESEQERFWREYGLAVWRLLAHGEDVGLARYEARQRELVLGSPICTRLDRWSRQVEEGPLRRRLQLCRELIRETELETEVSVAALRTELSGVHVHHRASYRGRSVAEHELLRVLRFSDRRQERRAAYEARCQIALELAEPLTRLMVLRNDVAQAHGHVDGFYAARLRLEDLDAAAVEVLLQQLEDGTDAAWEQVVEARRVALGVGQLRPWDMAFDFRRFRGELDIHFPREALAPRLRGTLAALGFDLDSLPIVIDDEPRPGKSQHAYQCSISIPDDVRVLYNAEGGADSARVLFHEMGHALHAVSIRADSYLLRAAPSSSFSEGVAQLLASVASRPAWLTGYAGVPAAVARDAVRLLAEEELAQLRRMLLLVRFEERAYADPHGDLDALWRRLSQRFLSVVSDPATPSDWARVVHLVSPPVYLQCYVLADAIAAQLAQTATEVGRAAHARGQDALLCTEVGAWLRDSVFAPGARWRWQELLQRCTGASLRAGRYLDGLLSRLDQG